MFGYVMSLFFMFKRFTRELGFTHHLNCDNSRQINNDSERFVRRRLPAQLRLSRSSQVWQLPPLQQVLRHYQHDIALRAFYHWFGETKGSIFQSRQRFVLCCSQTALQVCVCTAAFCWAVIRHSLILQWRYFVDVQAWSSFHVSGLSLLPVVLSKIRLLWKNTVWRTSSFCFLFSVISLCLSLSGLVFGDHL